MRKGLYIDDDEVRQVDQYQKLDPNRQKGKFEKELDAMLFGTTTKKNLSLQSKNIEQPNSQLKTSIQQNKTNSLNGRGSPVKTANLPKSYTIDNESAQKVQEMSYSKTVSSLLINSNQPMQVFKTIQPSSPLKKPNNNLTNKQKTLSLIENVVESIKLQQFNTQPLPAQPVRYQEPKISDIIYPNFSKIGFYRPGYITKFKKIAEDYNFVQDNVRLHYVYDVVRFSETDRSRQKKLNQYNFKDFVFPPSSVSIGRNYKDNTSAWKKPQQICKTVVFGKYIDPNDLQPGTLSSTHFLSTLSSLCEYQPNIKRLIQDQKYNSNGFYLIRIFVNSVWRYVAVDSLVPFLQNENIGVLGKADAQLQLSSTLIQKAYAKSFNGYEIFSQLYPRQYYLRDLTGAPVTKYSIDNPQLNNIIKKSIKDRQVVIAVPNQNIITFGINPNYSYNVINLNSKGNLQLRNSWGTFGDKSKVKSKNQGIFELSPLQIKDSISYFMIAHVNPVYFTSTIQSSHKVGFYSSYHFKIFKDTHGYLTVSQWDERLFPPVNGYKYSPFHLIIHKIQSKQHSTLANASFSENSRNLDLEVNLNAGSYIVFCAANWINEQHPYNLTFYGSQKIQFQRIYTNQIPNLIGKGFQSLNLKEGTRTSKSKSIIQYFLYHSQSNLIILTLQNISDSDTNGTIDISKVNLDDLNLLTSHNKQQNYSNKIDIQIDQYKGTALTERNWSVLLGPHQTFTWILAVALPYNLENTKNWEFN